MKPIRAIAILLLAILASCGTGADKKSNTTSSSEQKFVPFSQRVGGGGTRDPNSFRQDANGKLKIDNAKRSPYESKGEASVGGKTYQKKEYKAGDYAKKSWWGNKDYDRKSYTGNTDGSRFQKPSALGEQGARESGSKAKIPEKYDTGNYATGSAREGANSVNRDSAATAREQGRTNDEYQWNEARQISVDQSKSLLGR